MVIHSLCSQSVFNIYHRRFENEPPNTKPGAVVVDGRLVSAQRYLIFTSLQLNQLNI